LERISILFNLAEEAVEEKDFEKANYYVESARKISMRVNTPIPSELKRRICSHCHHFLKPGVNSQVRIDGRRHRVEVKCLDCAKHTYYPYVRDKKNKKS
jgi:ribonuclease P protein subunit RPR2